MSLGVSHGELRVLAGLKSVLLRVVRVETSDQTQQRSRNCTANVGEESDRSIVARQGLIVLFEDRRKQSREKEARQEANSINTAPDSVKSR